MLSLLCLRITKNQVKDDICKYLGEEHNKSKCKSPEVETCFTCSRSCELDSISRPKQAKRIRGVESINM